GHDANDGTGSTPLIPRGDNAYLGYNPHSYRHTAFQFACRAGVTAKREHPESYSHFSPHDFARAVVGHDLVRSVGDVYRDLNQEHLARVAIDYAWVDLRFKPVLIGPDPQAIEDASGRLELLMDMMSSLRATLVELEERQREISRRQATLSGDQPEAARLESNTLVFQLARLQTEIASTQSRLTLARRDLEAALTDEVSLDDYEDVAEHEEHLSRVRVRADAALNRVAFDPDHVVTVRELAHVLETTPKTINGWIRNGFPASRNPLWQSEQWTARKEGKRALPVSCLGADALSPIQQERLLLLQLQQAWGRRTEAA